MPKHDLLCINDVSVDCIVGVYPHERRAPQPLVLNLELAFDAKRAAFSGKISQTLDYARLCSEIRFILQCSRFLLIEEAAEAIASYALLGPQSQAAKVSACTLRLSKPNALTGSAAPTLKIYRESPSSPSESMLFKTEATTIYLHKIPPKAQLNLQAITAQTQHELAVDPGVLIANTPMPAGYAAEFQEDERRSYLNPSHRVVHILGVYRHLGGLNTDAPKTHTPLPQLVAYYEPQTIASMAIASEPAKS